MLVWIVIAIGLVLVVEGLLYALAPSLARHLAEVTMALARHRRNVTSSRLGEPHACELP